MKVREGEKVVFKCDFCGEIAGEALYEDEALRLAREKVRREGWEWFHPGWGLKCPECEYGVYRFTINITVR